MTTTNTPAPAPQPLLDLQRLVVAIRRKRRFWLSLGLVGLVAGAALAILVPPPPTAVTRLLIVHEQDQPTDGGTLMRTDIALIETTRIATAALKSLNLDETPEDFLKTYEAVGLTNNVLELKAHGTDDADAIARAKAVADVFIADHVQRIQAAAAADAQALLNQRDQAQAELSEVDASIAATLEAEQPDAPAQLETLYARRAELTSQISDLARRAKEAGIGAPRVAAGTQIVDAPRALIASTRKTAATNGALGLVLGLTVGLALTAVTTVVRDRPVLRREIAANLGVSVIAQLPAPRGLATLWMRSRRLAERKRIAAMLVRATRDDPGSVSLLELGTTPTTVALAADMAEILAAEGPVVLVDDLPGGRLRKRNRETKQPIRVVDGAVRPTGRHRPNGNRESQVGVGSVAPGTAWTDLGQLGNEAVLVVRAGRMSTAWLHTVARQLADLQIPVIGVVLVDPDPRDRSDGTLWDGLHSAVRGRPVRPAVPAGHAGHAGSAGHAGHAGHAGPVPDPHGGRFAVNGSAGARVPANGTPRPARRYAPTGRTPDDLEVS